MTTIDQPDPALVEAATPETTASEERLARHNAVVLAVAQAINGAAQPILITLGGVAGYYLLGDDKTLATVPVTGVLTGVALGAWPAARLMRRIGRRRGFLVGTLFGAAGGLIAAYAVYAGLFWLLVAAGMLNGVAASFMQQYRFAAADIGDKDQRARSISWVLAGGVASAVIGPQMVIFTRDLFLPIPFIGTYIAISCLSVLGAMVLLFLRDTGFRAPADSEKPTEGRPLLILVTQPSYVVALVCAASVFGLMTLMMTAAPLAMVACDHSQDAAALGVQWHVLAMFAPSFVTGKLIARFGAGQIVAAGLGLLALAAVAALTGITLAHFWGALVLLGVGWNFGFIGATTMLTQTYRPEEASRAQGFNDMVVFATTGLTSFASGSILNSLGWEWIGWMSLPVVVVAGTLVYFFGPGRRSAAGRPV